MDKELIHQLSMITEEEQEILNGRTEIDRERYAAGNSLVIDSKKMLKAGKLIQLRPHTRFIHFPEHKHNYVEVIYMCKGQTIHIINGNRIRLKEGELLFLNQQAVQEILPAGEADLAVNFIILPEFFDVAFGMMGQEANFLRDFLVGCLNRDGAAEYDNFLHYQVSAVLPIQNLIENMIWSLLHDYPNKHLMNQTTMGLIFLYLVHHTDKLKVAENSYEQNFNLQVLAFVEQNYRDGQLTELAEQLNMDIFRLSRAVKRQFGHTFKELMQAKRLNRAAFLLLNTSMPVSNISLAVGYDNTSYFHRLFRGTYGMSPKEYREKNREGLNKE